MARTVGSKNKIGAEVKANIVAVFERSGGLTAMTEWAKRHRSEFYRLYARLVPTEVTGTIDLRDMRELSEGELYDVIAESPSSSGAIGEETRETQPPILYQLPGPGVQTS